MRIELEVKKKTGVIPFKIKDGRLQVLVITSTTGKTWLIPKGNVKQKLGALETARLEAYEEAGAVGKIREKSVTFKKDGCQLTIFPMKVKRVFKSWPESSIRNRKWVRHKQAMKLIKCKKLRKTLMNMLQELQQTETVTN